MDDSKVAGRSQQKTAFNGHVIPIRSTPGAAAVRVVHRDSQLISEHRHDWLCLTFPWLGGGTEEFDGGAVALAGASGIVHPPGAAHADSIGATGLETISVQLDPAWLRLAGFDANLDRSTSWSGGQPGAAGRRLARLWASSAHGEAILAAETAKFLWLLRQRPEHSVPRWLDHLKEILGEESPPPTSDIARRLDLNPAWFARASRAALGEGIHEFLKRKRVGRAAHMLRTSKCSLAEIAMASGFCDQSHMNRNFRSILGRTPLQVRREINRRSDDRKR